MNSHHPFVGIAGNIGVGKTTLVHLSALKLGFNLIELNASDVRSKKKLELFFDPLLKNHNLFNQKYIILALISLLVLKFIISMKFKLLYLKLQVFMEILKVCPCMMD